MVDFDWAAIRRQEDLEEKILGRIVNTADPNELRPHVLRWARAFLTIQRKPASYELRWPDPIGQDWWMETTGSYDTCLAVAQHMEGRVLEPLVIAVGDLIVWPEKHCGKDADELLNKALAEAAEDRG